MHKRIRTGAYAVTLWLAVGTIATAFHPDNLDAPWPIVHGNLGATANSTGTPSIPLNFGSGTGIELAWQFDPAVVGAAAPGPWCSMVFDRSGNLYWHSGSGSNKISSIDPNSLFRWTGKNAAGTGDYILGSGWNSTSPLVSNHPRVFVLGAGVGYIGGDPAMPDPLNRPVVCAFDKATGALLWETFLPEHTRFPNGWSDNAQVTPTLYNDKLYVIGEHDGTGVNIYQLHPLTGALHWGGAGSFVGWPASGAKFGAVAFAPNFFGGFHGLFIQTDSGAGNDLDPEVVGIQIDFNDLIGGASLVWGAEGGKAIRGHPIFSAATQRVYTHTWNDYGAELYSFDALTGAVIGNQNAANVGHGFYDVGVLDFDGQSIIAGGFDGKVVQYTEDGVTPGMTIDRVLPFTNDDCAPNWFGEYRSFGQLLQDDLGNSMLITGTNSRVNPDPNDPFCPALGPGPYPGFTARAVILNITQATTSSNRPIVEYDTGVDIQNGFTLLGGPLIGPDGKMYYFRGDNGELVALIPSRLRADPNCDTVLDDADIPALITALIDGPGVWSATYSCGYLAGCDLNNDGRVNGRDIAAFIDMILP